MTITDWNANTYWNGNGKYQAKADKIQEALPLEGVCTNPQLEEMRVLFKMYYDWHNGDNLNNSNKLRTLTSDEIESLLELAMDCMIGQF